LVTRFGGEEAQLSAATGRRAARSLPTVDGSPLDVTDENAVRAATDAVRLALASVSTSLRLIPVHDPVPHRRIVAFVRETAATNPALRLALDALHELAGHAAG
jgi:hypothetical protein